MTRLLLKPRLAILGAGPVGIEAALYATALGLPFQVYERDRIAEHLRRWGHVPMFTPFGLNATPLELARIRADFDEPGLPDADDTLTGTEHYEAYLEPLVTSDALAKAVRPETEVVAVARRGFLKEDGLGDPGRATKPFRLLVRDAAKGERLEEADVVLDCTGTYGQPRPVGEGGIPAEGEAAASRHITYGLDDILGAHRDRYKDKTVLVVGSGHTAATSVTLLAKLARAHPGTWVIWLARAAGSQPVKRFLHDPLRERDRIAVEANTLATRADGNVEYHPAAQVEALALAGPDGPVNVRATVGGAARAWAVDRVLVNVGSSPGFDFTRELQVEVCPAWMCPKAVSVSLTRRAGPEPDATVGVGPAALRHPEPNYFVLGAKSFGRYPHFYLRTGFEQVREVFALITKQPRLDLYKQPPRAA